MTGRLTCLFPQAPRERTWREAVEPMRCEVLYRRRVTTCSRCLVSRLPVPRDFSPWIDLPRSVMDCLPWTCHFAWEARSEHVSNISLPQPNGIDDSSKRDSSAAGVLILLFKVHCLPGGTSKQKQLVSLRAEKKKAPCPRTPPPSQPSWPYQLLTKNLNVGQPQSTPRISKCHRDRATYEDNSRSQKPHQGIRWGMQPASQLAV